MNGLRKYIIVILLVMPCFLLHAELSIDFKGSQKKIIKETPDKSTGLNTIFIVWDINEVTEIVISGIDKTVESKVYVYSNLGGAFAKEVSCFKREEQLIIPQPTGNCGYIIENGSERLYFWIVDYSVFKFFLDRLEYPESQICGETKLEVEGNGGKIIYYTINGRPIILNREIELQYSFFEYDTDHNEFTLIKDKKFINSFEKEIIITPALNAATEIEVSGDRFLKEWNKLATSSIYISSPNGLNVETTSILLNKDMDTDKSIESAPLEYRFTAYTTEGVVHTEWQIAEDPEFKIIEYSFLEKEIDFTFTQEGVRYVRFAGSNRDGSCVEYGTVYEIKIGASELLIPNIFSPNGDGINDIWKISGKSLLSFRCWIFDKNGHELYFFDDPSTGWDGTYKGKPVASGVYYYVIEAIGSDNKKYKKGGDINLIKKRSSIGKYVE